MKLFINGREADVPQGAALADVIKGEQYEPGSAIALIRSMEQVKKETSEFEIVTTRGSFVVHVPEGRWQPFWREIFPHLKDKTVRWQTSKVTAIGAFPSSAVPSRDPAKFTRYDCFFALGGYDNRTTYIMISRQDHSASYGVADPVFGRVTRGRHVLDSIQETDRVIDIRPVIIEFRSADAFATTDLSTKVEEGMSVETYVGVKMDPRSPVSVEHFLVAGEKGTMTVTDKSESFTAVSTRMDVSLVAEAQAIRDEDMVTVRHSGPGMGRIYFYQRRRQTVASHNIAGRIVNGHQLIHLAPLGSTVTVRPDPARVMVIGMTQKEGQAFLESRGLRQVRTGTASDDAIIVEQEPELTIEAMAEKDIETFGTTEGRITYWYLLRQSAPNTVRYVEKMTGLDHKPIGTLKVHFTFEGMPMVTFEGDDSLGAKLFPEPSWTGMVHRGDIGITNMSRPNRGIMGIRLQDSAEFGPTGEEGHGTNMVGRFSGDLERMMAGLKDGDIVYVRETFEDPDLKIERQRQEYVAPVNEDVPQRERVERASRRPSKPKEARPKAEPKPKAKRLSKKKEVDI
ncbi:MAG: hypothetical protein A4E32_01341 [Methanomassiliicoccales archaeon PtaU1.Bin124]|nr:MAG: hypothetical protein A4E32_01341 [Methanomassiliicoccales archaeon PtaU1.Bin124]